MDTAISIVEPFTFALDISNEMGSLEVTAFTEPIRTLLSYYV